MTPFTCDEARELAPDLALGQLAGDNRGAMVDHLATCAPCRRHVEELVGVVDELLLLAPAVEPSIGFESRVMGRLTADGALSSADEQRRPSMWRRGGARPGGARPGGARPGGARPGGARPGGARLRGGARRAVPVRSRPWERVLVVTATAAAVLALVGTMALHRGQSEGRAAALARPSGAAKQLATRTVVVWADGGRSMCQLVAFPRTNNGPARLVVHLDEPGLPPDTYRVLAVPVGHGPPVMVGTIAVSDGQGTLATAIPSNAGPVDAVRVLDGNGSTKYSATFAAV